MICNFKRKRSETCVHLRHQIWSEVIRIVTSGGVIDQLVGRERWSEARVETP